MGAFRRVLVVAPAAGGRKFALEFIHDHRNPELESIRYMSEGSMNRAGDRGASVVLTVDEKEYEGLLGHLTGDANAIVTIAGKEYRELLGIDLSMGDVFPSLPPGSVPGPVSVVYSNGATEVLE